MIQTERPASSLLRVGQGAAQFPTVRPGGSQLKREDRMATLYCTACKRRTQRRVPHGFRSKRIRLRVGDQIVHAFRRYRRCDDCSGLAFTVELDKDVLDKLLAVAQHVTDAAEELEEEAETE